MPPKLLHGARAKVAFYDPVTGLSQVVGIWNSFSYSVTYDVSPAFIIGRFSAATLVTTAVEPVRIDAGGYRVVGHGPSVDGHLTNIRDLLTQEFLILTVFDRQAAPGSPPVAMIRGCLPTGTSTSLSARQLMETTNSYVGLLMDDESQIASEASDAADLP